MNYKNTLVSRKLALLLTVFLALSIVSCTKKEAPPTDSSAQTSAQNEIDHREFMKDGLADKQKVQDVVNSLVGKTVKWSNKSGTTYVYYESDTKALFKIADKIREATVNLETEGKICYTFKEGAGHCVDVPKMAEPGRRKRVVKMENDKLEIEVFDGKVL